MEDDEFLKEKFLENAMSQHVIRVQQESEKMFNAEKKSIEDFYMNTIVSHEGKIEEMALERGRLESELTGCRSDLEKSKLIVARLDDQISRLKKIEVRSETLEAKISELEQQKSEILKKKDALKLKLTETLNLESKLGQDIKALTEANKKMEGTNLVLNAAFAEIKTKHCESQKLVSELEAQIYTKTAELESLSTHKQESFDAYESTISALQVSLQVFQEKENAYLLALENFKGQTAASSLVIKEMISKAEAARVEAEMKQEILVQDFEIGKLAHREQVIEFAKKIETLENSESDLAKIISEKEMKISEHLKFEAELEGKLRELEANFSKHQEYFSDRESQNEAAIAEIMTLKSSIAAKAAERETLESQLGVKMTEVEAVNASHYQLTTRISEIESQLALAQSELAEKRTCEADRQDQQASQRKKSFEENEALKEMIKFNDIAQMNKIDA